MMFIANESTARERARQSGVYKYWAMYRLHTFNNVFECVGYSVGEEQVTEWAASQIAVCSIFRIEGRII